MRGYACIGLHNPKNPLNVGAVLRAAGCYDASLVVVGGNRPSRYINKCATDTQKQYRRTPVLRVEDLHTAVPFDCVPIAVDLVDVATSLCTYTHPERAFYIFGPEDGTLGKAVLDWCRDVVSIPTTYCMNLAAAVNVVLYDRLCKEITR